MTGPRYLALVTAIATLAAAIGFILGRIVPYLPMMPLLIGGALLLGVGLRRVRSRRGRSILIVAWVAYDVLAAAAFALATVSGIDLQVRGVISLFLLIGVAGLMWVLLKNGRSRTYSYHNYFDN